MRKEHLLRQQRRGMFLLDTGMFMGTVTSKFGTYLWDQCPIQIGPNEHASQCMDLHMCTSSLLNFWGKYPKFSNAAQTAYLNRARVRGHGGRGVGESCTRLKTRMLGSFSDSFSFSLHPQFLSFVLPESILFSSSHTHFDAAAVHDLSKSSSLAMSASGNYLHFPAVSIFVCFLT